LFYEKISKIDLQVDLVPTLDEPPELSSMSWCRIKQNSVLSLPETAFDKELLLIMQDVTAQFVTKEQYQLLLFILGQKGNTTDDNQQSYKKVLTLFNEFDTSDIKNFQTMLYQLQFPFLYNENKSLAENRRDFKDFFSCLTNIRCAVVEGSHRCEAACRSLQGYQLGDSIPLDHHDIEVPPNSTLFNLTSTQVYSQNSTMKLNTEVLEQLRGISEKLAEQKEIIVPITWHWFFNNVLSDINNNKELLHALYDTQEEFYKEDVIYKEISKVDVRSNKIKMFLHQILTKATFKY
jgi:hypothetical protein